MRDQLTVITQPEVPEQCTYASTHAWHISTHANRELRKWFRDSAQILFTGWRHIPKRQFLRAPTSSHEITRLQAPTLEIVYVLAPGRDYTTRSQHLFVKRAGGTPLCVWWHICANASERSIAGLLYRFDSCTQVGVSKGKTSILGVDRALDTQCCASYSEFETPAGAFCRCKRFNHIVQIEVIASR